MDTNKEIEEKVLAIINILLYLTKDTNSKWKDGSEEGEFLSQFDSFGVLIGQKEGEDGFIKYHMNLINEKGDYVFEFSFNDPESKLYNAISQLYNVVKINSQTASIALDKILEALNKISPVEENAQNQK